MVEIKYSGSFTREDFEHLLVVLGRRREELLVTAFPFLLAAGLIVFFTISGVFPRFLNVLTIPALLVASTPLFWLGLKLKYRSGWKRADSLREPRSGSITDSAIYAAGPLVRTESRWELFCGYRSSDRMVLLYTEPNHAVPFLKSFFQSDADWDAFRKLVSEKVPLMRKGLFR